MNEWQQALWKMHHAPVQPLTWQPLKEKGITADVLRLDTIHPVVSGNKLFKLAYHLDEAIRQHYSTLLTFGGAWSNHIVATAYAAQQYGLSSVGIIRGEAPAKWSQTLLAATGYGMRLEFVSREAYERKTMQAFTTELAEKYPGAYIVPEGGFGPQGIKGCKQIMAAAHTAGYTHIMCCIGTGAMFTGLANGSLPGQQIIGIPVLKGMHDLLNRFAPYFEQPSKMNDCMVFYHYHFGGYAKKTPELLRFMHAFFNRTGIPTDFVYTAKLMFACTDLAEKDHFQQNSRILLIHSGGLQGNASLPDGTLAW